MRELNAAVQLPIVQMLLSYGADPNATLLVYKIYARSDGSRDKHKGITTPLKTAIMLCTAPVVEALVRAGVQSHRWLQQGPDECFS